MSVIFFITEKGSTKKAITNNAVAYLDKDHWDDYSYRTSFDLTVFDVDGKRFNLGHVKIGYKGQAPETRSVSYTSDSLPTKFNVSDNLDSLFSVGQDVEYYKVLMTMSEELRVEILSTLKDVAFDLNLLNEIENEGVFTYSLRRDIHDPTFEIKNIFHKILDGASIRTPFNFNFTIGDVKLDFDTDPTETPPSNIHVLIGRNGAGKTTLLNNMVCCQLYEEGARYGGFYNNEIFKGINIPKDYFSSLVFVSFSVFDSFEYPEEYSSSLINREIENEVFSYIGLKTKESLSKGSESTLKNKNALKDEFIYSLKACFRFGHTKTLWLNAINLLHSDDNFADMKLDELVKLDDADAFKQASEKFLYMSSGHAIVLLTITKLITEVKEKSLVLIDEPEGHLHPPLLAAFMHSLSDLLIYRNGIAIIATHSPVVLQEVPKKCVWNIIRYGENISPQRLETETYGENVGMLTREVFGLEVKESGFHKKLKGYVSEGLSYEKVLSRHGDALGLEGRSILKSLIYKRDKKGVS